ncbi:MAG: N-acetyltransferase [Cohaesibacteraceae bacterium]|nr:N-acetyltransferase [Cohaesibacteraceae bacterium]MBL4876593.1 N-acetyltransferase [Cohaesibacteraceae bacterium]
MKDQPIQVQIVDSAAAIGRNDWNRCANPVLDNNHHIGNEYNPFTSFDFINALEKTGCASPETGWMAQHLVLVGDQNIPLAILPCYLKNHSMGEYVFDHGWADAFARAGGQYYPKIQCSIPFTPVTSPRFLVSNLYESSDAIEILGQAAIELTKRHQASSLHLTFLNSLQAKCLKPEVFLQRTDQQFHWTNQDYVSFDDFLEKLTSRKRKIIRKERRAATANNISIVTLNGTQIDKHHWDDFFEFYLDTGDRKWGTPYLNREFFDLIGETMSDDILLVLAIRNGETIAAALNFIGSNTVYGRYWGCREEVPFLHFELCYYQAIDWAIAHQIDNVEAGAQGLHKLARGYLPVTTHSAHWIAHAGFRTAIANYLEEEGTQVKLDIEYLNAQNPYK